MENREGSAIVFVVMIFMVISILAFSIISINMNNLKQARGQEHSMEAYYLAYSGIEMGYAALLQDNDLLNKVNAGRVFDSLSDSNTDKDTDKHILFGDGKLDIKIIKVKNGTYRDWIKITSTGYSNNMKFSRTRSLYIDPDDQGKVIWENN